MVEKGRPPVAVRFTKSFDIQIGEVTGHGVGGAALEQSHDIRIGNVVVRGDYDAVSLDRAHSVVIGNISHLGPISAEEVAGIERDLIRGDKQGFLSRLVTQPEKIDAALSLWDRLQLAYQAAEKLV